MLRLGINVDHVATVRQARRIDVPDPVEAALLAEKGGADGITVHLREDRRHIQERDVELLRERARTKVNLEMAVTPEMAVRLGKFCGNGPGLWLRMQAAYDLWHAERRMKGELRRIPRAA